ncbi:MAG: hypothetical protein HYX53_05465 [Chloroflexi bacterium]|nr:hypothetical protein [Chloroflexota bacterium]
MPDRIEREIEEILAKLDEEPPKGSERKPISIIAHKDKRRAPGLPKRAPGPPLSQRITPTTLLFAGAATVIGGLVLSNFWSPLIWASFAGVVLFLGAFVWSFTRTSRPGGGAAAPRGHYWRDRYIEYEPSGPSTWDRLRRRFRRR